jgi:ribosomal protein L15
MRPGFEGGQTPIDMRLGKARGATSKDAMPIGPFRTATQPVNVGALESRFEAGAEVTPETLKAARLVRSLKVDVKILGEGELTKPLTVVAHAFSRSAVEKIEAAGGTVVRLRGASTAVGSGQRRRRGSSPPGSPTTSAEVAAEPDAPLVEDTSGSSEAVAEAEEAG